MTQFVAIAVRFVPKKGMYEAFKGHLFDLIEAMKMEASFVNTIVHEDVEKPGELILYEIWRGNRETFRTFESPRPYRQAYVKYRDEMLDEISAHWLTPISEWGSTLLGSED